MKDIRCVQDRLFTSKLWKILRGEQAGHSLKVYLSHIDVSHIDINIYVWKEWFQEISEILESSAWIPVWQEILMSHLATPFSASLRCFMWFPFSNLHWILHDYAWNPQSGTRVFLQVVHNVPFQTFLTPLFALWLRQFPSRRNVILPSFLYPPSFQPSSTKPFCSLNEELDSSWALGPLWLLTKYLAKCLFHIHEKNNMSISFSVFLTPHPLQQMDLLCVQSILVISHHLPSTIWRLLSYHFVLQTLWSSKL